MKEIRDLLIEEKNKNDSLKYEHVLVNDLNIVLSKLEKKIKEPYSYWNTIGNAFKDFFNL